MLKVLDSSFSNLLVVRAPKVFVGFSFEPIEVLHYSRDVAFVGVPFFEIRFQPVVGFSPYKGEGKGRFLVVLDLVKHKVGVELHNPIVVLVSISIEEV